MISPVHYATAVKSDSLVSTISVGVLSFIWIFHVSERTPVPSDFLVDIFETHFIPFKVALRFLWDSTAKSANNVCLPIDTFDFVWHTESLYVALDKLFVLLICIVRRIRSCLMCLSGMTYGAAYYSKTGTKLAPFLLLRVLISCKLCLAEAARILRYIFISDIIYVLLVHEFFNIVATETRWESCLPSRETDCTCIHW